jgi:predicted nucleic acid-binding protein
LSAIAAEELLQGSLARINWERSRSRPDVETASRFFTRLVTDLADFRLLPYTNAAEQIFQSWAPAVRRIGPNDCRIAASAIVHGYTVVTCNGKDFSRIPGAAFEDWSL